MQMHIRRTVGSLGGSFRPCTATLIQIKGNLRVAMVSFVTHVRFYRLLCRECFVKIVEFAMCFTGAKKYMFDVEKKLNVKINSFALNDLIPYFFFVI